MAKAKALTKAEKSLAIADIKTARAMLRAPIVEATAVAKAAEKDLVAATKAAANRIKELTKVRDTANAKVAKFSAASALGNAKLDAKLAGIEATPLLTVASGAAKKITAGAIEKAKAKTKTPAGATAAML